MRQIGKYILAVAAMAASGLQAQALTGAWRGELNLGQATLPIVFNFSENNGATTCTMDSPAQGAKGIPTTVVLCTADSVSLKCDMIGGAYNGRITPNQIEGTFSQRGYSFPLNLTPELSLEQRRPQTPKAPFPYTATDTTFSAADGAVLSGTMTVPDKMTAKTPVVVMVTGSGPQNRDEEIMEHRPFAVIADYLARNGVASFRYDDRGVAKSGGDFKTATTETFKNDAASAIKFIRGMFPKSKVGILGHSEGGTIAYMLGAEGIPDYIISLAGMAKSGKETLMEQNSYALNKAGMTGSDKDNALRLIDMVFTEIADQHRKGKSAPIDVDSMVTAAGLTVNPQILASVRATQNVRTPWFDAFVALNPREFLKSIKCPVLTINGDKDTQVSPDNLTVISAAVPKAQTHLLPGLNHLLQPAKTGDSSEYASIPTTISPEALALLLPFLNSLQ